MSAITAALSQIDRVAADRDLAPDPAAPLELETACEPTLLPDRKRTRCSTMRWRTKEERVRSSRSSGCSALASPPSSRRARTPM